MKKVREIRDAENSAPAAAWAQAQPREEISKRLDRSLAKVDQVLQFNLREMSLDDKFGKDRDKPISDYLGRRQQFDDRSRGRSDQARGHGAGEPRR